MKKIIKPKIKTASVKMDWGNSERTYKKGFFKLNSKTVKGKSCFLLTVEGGDLLNLETSPFVEKRKSAIKGCYELVTTTYIYIITK